MSEKMVSIITPCYNSENTIERTLQCIENHKSKLPSNLKVISEKDGGIYEAMNKGINMAAGKLIGIVNSDDWYENDTVEQVVNAYKGNKYEVIYGMQRNYLNGKEKTAFIHHHDFLPEQMITHPTCFVTKDTYNDLGLFDTNYRSAADYDLMLRFWESKKVTFTPIMRILSNFQMGGMSGSQMGVRENAEIRYKRGYMNKKKYYFVVIKSHIYEMLHKKK
jgi:glycosyltransferase involved in cell wall biosynthesis